VVLNNVKGSLPYYYNSSHYHYDYGSLSSSKQQSPSKGKRRHKDKKSAPNSTAKDVTDSGSGEARKKHIPR
jgi:hypothetical protein